MQQETTEKLFKVPSSDINVSKQTNTFLGGKLVIHEEEPIIDDTDEEPTEDSNILTTPIPTQAMLRDIRQKFQDTVRILIDFQFGCLNFFVALCSL